MYWKFSSLFVTRDRSLQKRLKFGHLPASNVSAVRFQSFCFVCSIAHWNRWKVTGKKTFFGREYSGRQSVIDCACYYGLKSYTGFRASQRRQKSAILLVTVRERKILTRKRDKETTSLNLVVDYEREENDQTF